MICMAMVMLGCLPVCLVDALVGLLAKLKYGDLSRYGIVRPTMGPMRLKAVTGRSAVIDVGTVEKIKTGEIKVNTDIWMSYTRRHLFSLLLVS